MKIPSLSELRQTFDYMSEQSYNGVEGYTRITSSGDPNPVVGITAMTHGNEPAGLAPIRYYLENDRLQRLLDRNGKGSVIFGVNNLEAADRFFCLPPGTSDREKNSACRSIDENMNRLPEDIFVTRDTTKYEVRRVLELYQAVLSEMEAGLDIHTMRTSAVKLIMEVKGAGKHHARNFPFTNIITNMIPVQKGYPISHLYGSFEKDIPVAGIEAGRHESGQAFLTAIQSTRRFLESLGVISRLSRIDPDTPLHEYRIRQGVIPPADELYRMERAFRMFEAIPAGEVLLRSAQLRKTVVLESPGHVMLSTPPGEDLKNTEEACFISEPVQMLDRSHL